MDSLLSRLQKPCLVGIYSMLLWGGLCAENGTRDQSFGMASGDLSVGLKPSHQAERE